MKPAFRRLSSAAIATAAAQGSDRLVRSAIVLRCIAAPAVLAVLLIGTRVWQQSPVAPETSAEWTAPQYAMQATRMDPYVEQF